MPARPSHSMTCERSRATKPASRPSNLKLGGPKRDKCACIFCVWAPSGVPACSLGRILKRRCRFEEVGPEEFHPHALRRCFATHCHDNGMPIEAVSKLLGHSKLSVTVRYTQVSTARMVQSYNAAHPHASPTAQVAKHARLELA